MGVSHSPILRYVIRLNKITGSVLCLFYQFIPSHPHPVRVPLPTPLPASKRGIHAVRCDQCWWEHLDGSRGAPLGNACKTWACPHRGVRRAWVRGYGNTEWQISVVLGPGGEQRGREGRGQWGGWKWEKEILAGPLRLTWLGGKVTLWRQQINGWPVLWNPVFSWQTAGKTAAFLVLKVFMSVSWDRAQLYIKFKTYTYKDSVAQAMFHWI